MIEKKKDYLQFSFDIQIKDLKNFTNLISQIKQNNFNFKIIDNTENKGVKLYKGNWKTEEVVESKILGII